MRRARLFTVFFMVLFTILISALQALASPCELPYQRISAECTGSDGSDVIGSGIAKRKEQPTVSDLLQDYRQKTRQSSEIVAKANDELRAYHERHR